MWDWWSGWLQSHHFRMSWEFFQIRPLTYSYTNFIVLYFGIVLNASLLPVLEYIHCVVFVFYLVKDPNTVSINAELQSRRG